MYHHACRPSLAERLSHSVAPVAALARLVAFTFICLVVSSFADAWAQRPVDRPVLVLDLKGAIGFVAAEQLAKALQRAAADGASVLVVRLDTPGGLLSSTREMIQAILASPVPVVMYVSPDGSRA